LTNLRWQRLQLVHIDLREKGVEKIESQRTPWTPLSQMTSHKEVLEVDELTNLRWQRLQLVFVELKERRCNEEIVTAITTDTTLSMASHI